MLNTMLCSNGVAIKEHFKEAGAPIPDLIRAFRQMWKQGCCQDPGKMILPFLYLKITRIKKPILTGRGG
jgi:hypothetical protein